MSIIARQAEKETILSLTETYLKNVHTRNSDGIADKMMECLAKPPVNPECPKERDARRFAESLIYAW